MNLKMNSSVHDFLLNFWKDSRESHFLELLRTTDFNSNQYVTLKRDICVL